MNTAMELAVGPMPLQKFKLRHYPQFGFGPESACSDGD
jgi:hypothetical protein